MDNKLALTDEMNSLINSDSDKMVKKIVEASGLDNEKSKVIIDRFSEYFQIAKEWKDKAEMIVVTSPEQKEEIKIAGEGRKFIKKKIVEVKKTVKDLKEDALAEQRAINFIGNVFIKTLEPIRDYLELQEKFVKIQKEKEEEELKNKRIEELSQFDFDQSTTTIELGKISDSEYESFLNGVKITFENKKKAEQEEKEREQREREQRQKEIALHERKLKRVNKITSISGMKWDNDKKCYYNEQYTIPLDVTPEIITEDSDDEFNKKIDSISVEVEKQKNEILKKRNEAIKEREEKEKKEKEEKDKSIRERLDNRIELMKSKGFVPNENDCTLTLKLEFKEVEYTYEQLQKADKDAWDKFFNNGFLDNKIKELKEADEEVKKQKYDDRKKIEILKNSFTGIDYPDVTDDDASFVVSSVQSFVESINVAIDEYLNNK